MKKKNDNPFSIRLQEYLLKLLKLSRLNLVSGITCLVSLLLSVFVVVSNSGSGNEELGDLNEFEAGRVADRDVIAARSFSFLNEEATLLRMQAMEYLAPAVFRRSDNVVRDSLEAWDTFSGFADSLISEGVPAASLILAVQSAFPGRFSSEILAAYFASAYRENFSEYGHRVLERLFAKGVFDLNAPELGRYNPDIAEVIFFQGGRTEKERIFFNDAVSLRNASEAIERISQQEEFSFEFRVLASALLTPFVRENVFFSLEDSVQRREQAREQVVPVYENIERGSRIIRRGFVITEDEMKALRAFSAAFPQRDGGVIFSQILTVILLYILFIMIQSKPVLGRKFSDREISLLFILLFLYIAGAALVQNITALGEIPAALVFPGALMVMIPAVFFGFRFALLTALFFPLAAFLTGFFDIYSYLFALISGAAASAILKGIEKRMDLIKAGLVIAAANCLALTVITLMHSGDISPFPLLMFWGALNGIISGMLFLGILPPLEHVLNAATTFRLIELSDLNAPILRKLFTTASGTYSHSIVVANLAEQACQDIGANALLARVGAYYHDLGKIENPMYFIENQTDHNRHDDIAPRLSATVIRSHVKLGVEKARSLGLPKDVIDIIAEHHGNSLITWFYNKATQQEEQVSSEDFAYPGNPPHSKESAVVMLADVTEAAVRTLVKPTVARMEKFIQQLFDAKVEHGQLAQSELTFRDLETIKNAFIKVLVAYHHSRIEYPKTGSGADSGSAAGGNTAGGTAASTASTEAKEGGE